MLIDRGNCLRGNWFGLAKVLYVRATGFQLAKIAFSFWKREVTRLLMEINRSFIAGSDGRKVRT